MSGADKGNGLSRKVAMVMALLILAIGVAGGLTFGFGVPGTSRAKQRPIIDAHMHMFS